MYRLVGFWNRDLDVFNIFNSLEFTGGFDDNILLRCINPATGQNHILLHKGLYNLPASNTELGEFCSREF